MGIFKLYIVWNTKHKTEINLKNIYRAMSELLPPDITNQQSNQQMNQFLIHKIEPIKLV